MDSPVDTTEEFNDEIVGRITPAVRRMLLRAYVRFSFAGLLDLGMRNVLLDVFMENYERWEQLTFMADSGELLKAMENGPPKMSLCRMDGGSRTGCAEHPNEYSSDCTCNFMSERYFSFREFRSRGMSFLNLNLDTVPDMPAPLKKAIRWSTRLIVCQFNKTLVGIPKGSSSRYTKQVQGRAICHALKCYAISTLKYAKAWDDDKETFQKMGMCKKGDLTTDVFECKEYQTEDV